MYVIGTAGHVDHGKSSLVRALSGIDPDRLKEEKSRGMTIDLGFAWIDLPMPAEGVATAQLAPVQQVGVIDVPGHIDFIKNMLAGVGGIDAVVLVIAADEGVMPQTREHLAIIDLLGVSAGLVALTKVDLIDEEDWLELVQLDISDLLQGTTLAAAPIIPVSALTGAGLAELRHHLTIVLGGLTPRRNRARPRLPVDRVFSLSGFGTVVTGTLIDGVLAVGDAVEILPAGLPARVRGLQTHQQPVERGRPGSRLAINLGGVGVDDLRRGDVVAHPGSLSSTQLIDVRFRLLATAARPLEHNQRVDFFCGAAETPAVVRLLGAEQLAPGEEGWLQLRLDRPQVVVSADRFILRQPSPSATLGGGVVISPHPRRRWPRFDPVVLTRLETLAHGAPDDILLQTLARRPFLTAKELLAASELDLASGAEALTALRQRGAVFTLQAGGDESLVTLDRLSALHEQLQTILAAFHQALPLRRGLSRGEARSRLQAGLAGVDLPVRLFNAVVEQMKTTGVIEASEDLVWLAGHASRLTIHQQAMVDHLLELFERAPAAPPNQPDSLRILGDDGELLEYLFEQGLLLRIGGDILFRPAAFAGLTAKIEAYVQAHGSITLAQARDELQTSRKYAQAVLEELDARRITRREGDLRVLRR